MNGTAKAYYILILLREGWLFILSTEMKIVSLVKIAKNKYNQAAMELRNHALLEPKIKRI